MSNIDTSNATLNIFLEVDGKVHLVAMEQEKLDAVSFLAKNSIHYVIPTNRTQAELNKFLGLGGHR